MQRITVKRIALDMWRLQRLERVEQTHFQRIKDHRKETIFPKENFDSLVRKIAKEALKQMPRDENNRIVFTLKRYSDQDGPSQSRKDIPNENNELRKQVLGQLEQVVSTGLSRPATPNVEQILYQGMTHKDDPCPLPALMQEGRLIEKNILRNYAALMEFKIARLTINGCETEPPAQPIRKGTFAPLVDPFCEQTATDDQSISSAQVQPCVDKKDGENGEVSIATRDA